MAAKKSAQKGEGESGARVVDVNKKARHDYEIISTAEAGIVLTGSEVKSIRQNGVSLRDSYVRMKGTECYLVGAHVAPYAFAGLNAHEPYRERKLLLHRREIERLGAQVQTKGLTLIPLRIYFNPKGRCKLEIGVGRGKKLHDKRQDQKAKEARRDMERALRTRE
ncbi:MAG: SsrA-binding protein SmpB [Bdellovibrionales bacterium]|nr:SsrA-binding protein SmpB [Bdellovibrionales bacterium]